MNTAYCTNVLAGHALEDTLRGIERVFVPVRAAVGSDGPLPIGLWLSSHALHQLSDQADCGARLHDWMNERGLSVVTLNAFPYQAFHADVVKHGVYLPSWADARRLIYTTALADLLPQLLPPGTVHASISTLPVGWRPAILAELGGAGLGVASATLHQLGRHLARVEDRTGVRIHVDLEPEPGCLLDRADETAAYLETLLRPRRGEPDLRRYVGVCHDVCHAAVMFEPQAHVLQRYRAAGLRVGKVQVSSAPACTGSSDELAVLASFAERRYLHQTCVRNAQGIRFYEDLPAALADAHAVGADSEWRTHFHVPVFAERLGALRTTQAEIRECLRTALSWPADEQPQVEVETYAWHVLPPAAGTLGDDESLVQGIAQELRWTDARVSEARAAAAREHA